MYKNYTVIKNSNAMQQQSSIRQWSAQKREEAKGREVVTLESFFASVIVEGLIFFAEPSTNLNGRNESLVKLGLPATDKFGLPVMDEYSGDSSLFEIGCYVCFNIDLWLFQNKLEYRDFFSESFYNQFVDLFSQAIKTNNIREILCERLGKYEAMVRAGEPVENYRHLLFELIKRTRDNTPPEHCDYERLPIALDASAEDTRLKIEILCYEDGMLPSVLKSVARYLEAVDKNKPANR